MDDRITGSFLVIVGLLIAGFGGSMSTIEQAIAYAVGFLIAFVGLGFFIRYRRKKQVVSDSD